MVGERDATCNGSLKTSEASNLTRLAIKAEENSKKRLYLFCKESSRDLICGTIGEIEGYVKLSIERKFKITGYLMWDTRNSGKSNWN